MVKDANSFNFFLWEKVKPYTYNVVLVFAVCHFLLQSIWLADVKVN